MTAMLGAEADPKAGVAAGVIRQNFPRAAIRYTHIRQESAAIVNAIIVRDWNSLPSANSRGLDCPLRTSLLATKRDHRIDLRGPPGRQVAGHQDNGNQK